MFPGFVSMRRVILVLGALLGVAAALLPGSFLFGTLIPPGFLRLVGYENLLLLAHLGAYGGLVVLGVWAGGRLLPVALGAFLFSVAVEGAQALTPWREGALDDVLLNLGAVLLGIGVVVLARSAWTLLRREAREGSGN